MPSTLHKHLRHLGAALRAAEDEGLIEHTPLSRKFTRDLRLRVPKGSEAYTDDDLARLWATMTTLGYEPVYVAVCKTAVVTGCRQGELIAASWGDLSVSAGTLAVRHHYDPVDGLTLPKDGEARTVSLIGPARTLLEAWAAAQGVQPDDAPLFPAPRSGGRLNGRYLTRLVTHAANKAGLAAVGEGGRRRKPFHGFRATYTRLCRERGLDLGWIQAQLGHSDPAA